MPVSKNRKGHKNKAATRRNQMVAKRKQVDKLVEELKLEMSKVDHKEGQPTFSGGSPLTITPSQPIEFTHNDYMEI
jgi:hypothetical protein